MRDTANLPGRPVLVGSVNLDLIHNGLYGDDLPPVRLRWGGVMANAACALAVCGHRPILISTDYEGELRWSVLNHLARNGVEWRTTQSIAPLPLYHVKVDNNGTTLEEHFFGLAAIDLLTSESLRAVEDVLRNAKVILTCTDLSREAISRLRLLAKQYGVPFGLLSADPLEVNKHNLGIDQPDYVALNWSELEAAYGGHVRDADGLTAAVSDLVTVDGHCIVTLGARGALVVARRQQVTFQPAPVVEDLRSTVGAGDVLFGCYVAAILRNEDPGTALRDAVARTTQYLRADLTDRDPYASLRTPCHTTDSVTLDRPTLTRLLAEHA